MTKFLTALSASALAATIMIVGLATEPADPVTAVESQPTTPVVTVSPTPNVVVTGADEDDQRRLGEALRHFHDHGLDLPDLDVRFYDDDHECQGHYGLFQTSFTPWRVLICTDLDFVPTHELAHAWEAANLDDTDRDRYIEERGLSSWNDQNVPWVERGVEDAAYQFLTGRESPLSS